MEYILRILSFIVKILDYIIEPIFRFLERDPPKRIPLNDEPLLRISATKLAKKIRQGEVRFFQICYYWKNNWPSITTNKLIIIFVELNVLEIRGFVFSFKKK